MKKQQQPVEIKGPQVEPQIVPMSETNLSNIVYPDSIELDPSKRKWYYDGDGTKRPKD